MYASIFTESEWKAPIRPSYRNTGCSTCGLGRYYNKESFRQFKFVGDAESNDVPNEPTETPTPAPTEAPPPPLPIQQLREVIPKLRLLPVKQLIDVLELVVPQDIAMKYKKMFPRSLQRLLDSYSNEEILQGILLLPRPSIDAIASLQVPQPFQLLKKATEPQMTISIDPSFSNSLLFTTFPEIPRNDQNYSFMDPTFAIGNANSSYDPFNIIVNLDFPYNGVPHHALTTELTSDKKLIFRVGIYDSPDEPMGEVLEALVPFLITLVKYHYNKPRLLFHCRAGISRSASVALAYYGKQMKYDLTKAYSQLATRRPVIQPNPGFVAALEEFLV
jgi:hypothetical protein